MASERTDGTVACIGVFDGVHRGHQALIARARGVADAHGLALVVVTFDPHPVSIVRPDESPKSLASLVDRVSMLEHAGADEVDVLRFDGEFARHTPEEFVHAVLVERLCARVVVVGANFRFGAGAAGDVRVLRELGSRHGFDVDVMELQADDEPWSSTRVRAHLASGEIEQATHILGRAYRLDGLVVHGDRRGRELGYPTANLHLLGDPQVPADGVYAGWLHALGERMPAAVSIGTNPQFGGQDRRIEAYAIDRAGLDLYGEAVQVEFAAFLRGQQVFDGLDAFISQMAADVDRCREMTDFAPGRAG